MNTLKHAFVGYAPNVATSVYTFVGQPRAHARIAHASFCNTHSAAVTVTLAVVPAGGTITDAQYRLLSAYSLSAGVTLWLTDEVDGTAGPVLKDGDQIVLLSDTASKLATRISVEEAHA